jgi:hypothetical protein
VFQGADGGRQERTVKGLDHLSGRFGGWEHNCHRVIPSLSLNFVTTVGIWTRTDIRICINICCVCCGGDARPDIGTM